MKRRIKGFNRQVLRDMVEKYEKILVMDDGNLEYELKHKFFDKYCPCCVHRMRYNQYKQYNEYNCFSGKLYTKNCPAIVDDERCLDQDWWNKAVRTYQFLQNFGKKVKVNIKLSRKLLTERMQFWKDKLKEEYNE